MPNFCDRLKDDLSQGGKDEKLDYGLYVDRYGKVNPGFINYNELKEMYMAHVHFAETGQREAAVIKTVNNKFGENHEALLKGLFNAINPDQRDKISRADFA